MDIYTLLDDFEKYVESCKKVPLSDKVLIDKEVLFDFIDNLRADLPEEIRQARWITKERERVLEEAKEEAEKIISGSKSKISLMAQESEIVKESEKKAEEIMQRAKEVAREIKFGADQYADEVLARLEQQLEKIQNEIANGRKELKKSS